MTEAPAQLGLAKPKILTIDNGATNTRIASGGETIDDIHAYKTPESYGEAIERIHRTTQHVLGGLRPDAVGFSIAGAPEDGQLIQAGKLQEYGWLNRPFAADVAAALSISASDVVLLNDCAAGANAERVARKLVDGETGVFASLSTGFGGALYTKDEIISDEPGHVFLREGAVCGCGQDGCIEAHISGSGIEKNLGVKGEDLSHDDPTWLDIKADFAEAMNLTLYRYEGMGHRIRVIGFTGSVALGGPSMLTDLRSDLGKRSPLIEEAVYRDESGLYGAYFAARDVLIES